MGGGPVVTRKFALQLHEGDHTEESIGPASRATGPFQQALTARSSGMSGAGAVTDVAFAYPYAQCAAANLPAWVKHLPLDHLRTVRPSAPPTAHKRSIAC